MMLKRPRSPYRRYQLESRIAVLHDQMEEIGFYPWPRYAKRWWMLTRDDVPQNQKLITAFDTEDGMVGLSAWLPGAGGSFFGIRSTDILKAMWPQDRIESLVYDDNPLLALVRR